MARKIFVFAQRARKANVTIAVSDGAAAAKTTFRVTVLASPTPPGRPHRR